MRLRALGLPAAAAVPLLSIPVTIRCVSRRALSAPTGRSGRGFLAGANLATAALAPFTAGRTGLDRAAYGGLLQRLPTLPLFLSVAAAGLSLRSRLSQLDPPETSP